MLKTFRLKLQKTQCLHQVNCRRVLRGERSKGVEERRQKEERPIKRLKNNYTVWILV